MKRILLVTQYFYPENFKSNDIAFELVKRGYSVDVLTSIPNYPEGVYYKGYGIFKRRFEIINGVNIYRVFQTPRGRKARGMGLSLNYVTYAISSSIFALFLMFKRYSCSIVHETSPITQALASIVLKKIRKLPFYIWVLDIWPDAMISGGGVKNKMILRFMNAFVKLVYNNADKILISSKDFDKLILRHGDYGDKIVYFPNWSDDVKKMPKKKIPILPKGFRIMMAGNLGSAQTIPAVMEAAKLLKHNNIKWIFVGDGSERHYIEKYRKDNSLEDVVYLMGKYPYEYMSAFYEQADAMLLTLKAKYPHLMAVVPARLQGYMASGKPVLGMVDGACANLIIDSDCGYVVPAEDYNSLVDIILHKVLVDKEEFAKKGINGRKRFEQEFTKDLCIGHLIEIIENE